MATIVFIYLLTCPDTGDVRYIGKTDDLRRRLKGHLEEKWESHKTRWIRKLLRQGKKPVLKMLFAVPEASRWQDAERFFIASARGFGFRITNATLGGDGLSFINEADKLRWRGRLTDAKIASWQDEVYRSHTIQVSKAGLARPEVRKKMSAIRKALRGSPAAREKQGKLTEKMWEDPQVRAKMSAGISASWADEERRAKHIAALKQAHATEEARAKRSAASKASWADSESRARRLQAFNKPERLLKLSEAKKRECASPEVLAAMSERAKAAWARRKAANASAT